MRLSTKDLVICSIFASITSILAQISIPIPFTTVPLTMQIFAVMLSGILLGSKLSFLSQIIYILLGLVGLPVFSQMTGGISILLGPTGGFIISFPIVAFLIGYFFEKYKSKFVRFFSMIIALLLSYILGIIQFCFITKMGFIQGLVVCVLPFVVVDLIKIILAYILGNTISKRINLKNYN